MAVSEAKLQANRRNASSSRSLIFFGICSSVSPSLS